MSRSKMQLFFGVCIIFLVICNAVSFEPKKYYGMVVKQDFTGDFLRERIKRSLPMVIELLLKKAKLKISVEHYRQFMRKGGYAQALKDFEALDPTNVKISGAFRQGNVDNTNVYVTTFKKHHEDGRLTIVTDTVLPTGRKGVQIDTIRYRK